MTDKPHPAGRTTVALAAIAVMIIAAVAYLPALDDSFLQDDFLLVGQFFTDTGTFELPRQPALTFPTGFLPFWTHVLDSYLWGAHAVGHRITSLLVHVLAALLVFVLVRRVAGGRTLVAFLAAVFFVLSPLHLNAVHWISGRSLTLAIVFLLLAALAATRRRPAPVLSATAYLAALLCHPAAFTAPLVALLVDVVAGRGAWRGRLLTIHLPLLALMAAYIVFQSTTGERLWHTRNVRAALAPAVLLDTLARLIVPLNEAITNPAKAPLLKWGVLLGLLPLQILVLIVRRAAPPRTFWVGLIWFVVMLIPILPSARLGTELADSRVFYGVVPPLALMLAALFLADTAVFRPSAGRAADRRALARATVFALVFAVSLVLALVKNGQAYAGAGRLVRHVQDAALEAARGESADSWIYLMEPPSAYAGAPVFATGLKRALAPPFRTAAEARRIGVVHVRDMAPLLERLRGVHPPLVVLWMHAAGLEPRRPFARISPLFPATGEPDEPFLPPRFAGAELATWRPDSGLVGAADERGFVGQTSSEDPWLLSPPMVIPSDWIEAVSVRMSVHGSREPVLPVDLFWAELSRPDAFRPERSCRQFVPTTGAMETLTFALSPPDGARPPERFLARLRLDPPPGPAAVHIESIALVPGPGCPCAQRVAASWEGPELAGWTVAPGTTGRLENSDLVLRTQGVDPYAVSPVLDLPAAALRGIEVALRVDAASTEAAIYWATDTPEGFCEEQRLPFTVAAGDGQFHRYTLWFQERARLAPDTRIRAIRVDPMAGPGTAWIRLVKLYQDALDRARR
ncbi:MAG: hypothetical protein JXQ29_03825 [Planctomycetes bacterium]|nr:hypothetical protein [Planctomycetota bacterium]